jgi:hypothetical protein
MKYHGFLFLPAFVALILAVGLACGGTTAPPAPATNPPQPAETEKPGSNSGGLKTFTDQNDYYQIEVPSDWKYSQTVDDQDDNYYIDTFTSPDENALIENIVYDDGTAFTGSQKAKFALYLLNTFYSDTGKEGDIRVSDDSIQKDGSERLIWRSTGGKYSGTSFLETRGSARTTFLFFTTEYSNDFEDTYLELLNDVIASYTIP